MSHSLNLSMPIFHPTRIHELRDVLARVCFDCSSVLDDTRCKNCGLKQPEYTVVRDPTKIYYKFTTFKRPRVHLRGVQELGVRKARCMLVKINPEKRYDIGFTTTVHYFVPQRIIADGSFEPLRTLIECNAVVIHERFKGTAAQHLQEYIDDLQRAADDYLKNEQGQ